MAGVMRLTLAVAMAVADVAGSATMGGGRKPVGVGVGVDSGVFNRAEKLVGGDDDELVDDM